MPKSEWCWHFHVLIVCREIQPDFVTGLEASSIGHKRNAVSDLPANWNCFEDAAREHRRCLLAPRFIDFSQSGTEITCSTERSLYRRSRLATEYNHDVFALSRCLSFPCISEALLSVFL